MDRSKCVDKFRFAWGYVTHPGVWACGGGRKDIPPVLVGITFQVPQKEPEYAWWCYLGPKPEFENEFDPEDKDKRYFEQCKAIPHRVTKNMSDTRQMNELRKWLAHEMQDEAQTSGEVNRSDHARMRAMAKAVAYNRVMQKMDEIELGAAKAEIDNAPLISDMRIVETSGYFESIRRTHPVKLGDVIDGKRVIGTFWQWSPENGNVPMYRVDGEGEAKVFTK